MGVKGKQSKRGEGEKESFVRDSLLKVKVPFWKLKRLKNISSIKRISLTDLINEILTIFLSTNAEDFTQQNEDKDEG